MAGEPDPKQFLDKASRQMSEHNDNPTIISTKELESFEKEDDLEQIPALKAYFRLWRYSSSGDVFLRMLGAAAALGAGTTQPLQTIVFGSLVNVFNDLALGKLSPAEFRKLLNRNTLWFVYLFIGKFCLTYIAALLYSLTATRMARRLRITYLQKVLHQPISYFDRHTAGTIASSLSTDVNVIEVGLGEKVASLIEAVGMVITAFGIAFSKSWKLTLVVATVIPYMIITTVILASADTKVEKKVLGYLSKSSSIAEEALSNVMNISALGAKEKVLKKFNGPIKVASTLGIWRGPLQSTIYGNMFFSIQCAYALTLFYGVRLSTRGEIKSGGNVIIVLFCMIIASSSMGMMAPTIPILIKAVASSQQILNVIGTERAVDEKPQGEHIKLQKLKGHIAVQNLKFSYPERPTVTVLDSLTFDIAPKKVTAIVGHSGSGKSTVVGMIERWYEPRSGSITVDGKDLRNLDLKWWRGQVGLVQQEPMLFNDTVFQNVLNGYHGAKAEHLSEEEKRQLVVDACKQADAHDFINALPEKYETNVGERADLLSGGQKQRIAIARSIISNPLILLLDEATSALDDASEQAVEAALEKASRGRTTLIIAHKLSSVKNADKIIVMDKGRLVEEGTHAELLEKNGTYCRLLQAQVSQEARSHQISDQVEKREGNKGSNLMLMQVPQALDSTAISRRKSLIASIWRVLCEQREIIPSFFGGAIASFIGGGGWAVLAFLFSKLVTVFQLQGQHRVDRGNFWALMFFILAITNLLAYSIGFFLFAIAGSVSTKAYRAQYLGDMLSQDEVFFEVEGNTSGALTSLLSSDSDDLMMMISMNIGLIMIFSVDLIACCILALIIGWKLALVIIFGSLPFLLGLGWMRMRMDTRAQDRCARFFLESARYGSEAVGAIRTVSSLVLEEAVIARYGERLQTAVFNSSKRLVYQMVFYSLSDSFNLLAAGLAFWYGGRLVSFGEMTVGNYFIVYTAIIIGGQAAGFVFGYSTSISKAHAAANRIHYLHDARPAINTRLGFWPPPYSSLTPAKPIIEFRNVSFTYPTRPDHPVLKDLSLSIFEGENLCLTGSSGCGKSTILSLLERFYEVDLGGEILVYGICIRDYDVHKLRGILGFVGQDAFLISGSIKENLLLGVDENVTEVEIKHALEQVSLREWVDSLPQGVNTDVGTKGIRLSGGQRQRIGLARVLLRKPKILLLDEVTSALDGESAACVMRAVEEVNESGVTVIDVSHREEVVRRAGRIVVLEGGRIQNSDP